MVPEGVHDFFLGSAGVAGALIGLLFVAISVSADRLKTTELVGQVHRIRAYGALVAFTNALAVSLFALIPDESIGTAALSVGCLGLLFVAASLLSLIRLLVRQKVRVGRVRDGVFLVGMAVAFIFQITSGIDVMNQPHDASAVDTLAILVIIFFLVGISRSWELIGGPSIGFTHEVVALTRREEHREEARKEARADRAGARPGDEAAPAEPAPDEPPA